MSVRARILVRYVPGQRAMLTQSKAAPGTDPAERMDVDSQIRLTNALIGGRVLELSRRRLRFAPAAGDGAPVIAGDTAYVTRMHHQEGSYLALRVAQDRSVGGEWERHYAALARDLPEPVRAYVPRWIAPIEGGITIAGTKLPTVVMEWIDGLTLFEAADHAASEGNRRVMLALADSLLELYAVLRDARVTHGDLAPGNLMMRSTGEIVCVDLDTVQWPGMRVRSLQAGSPAYRHPRRGAIPRHQDAFAVLVLLTSLHVLADAPGIRQELGQEAGVTGAGLVFTSWDLADPSSSRAFSTIRKGVGGVTRQLLDLLERSISSEPYLTPEILAEAMEHPADEESGEAPERPSSREWDLSSVIERLRTELDDQGGRRDEGRFATTWPSATEPEQLEQEPVALEPATEEPEPTERQSGMSALEREEARADRFRQRIAEAARQHDDEAVVRAARAAEERHLPLGSETRRIVRLARERMEIRVRLDRALAEDNRPALADLARTGELVVLGDTDRASLARVLRALEWPGLVRALESDDDALILTWYDDELFGEDQALPEDLRARVELARTRTRWVAEVRAVLKRRDVRALESLLAGEPKNGLAQLSRGERARVLRLIERQSALDDLHDALRHGSSERILKALNAIDQSGARIENPSTWAAVQSVLERATVIEQIVTAASADPPDDRELAHLLPFAKRLGLQSDPALARRFAFDDLERMVLRGAAARRIRRAIRDDDDAAIRQAAYPDVNGALSLLTDEERRRVETARSRRIAARAGAQ